MTKKVFFFLLSSLLIFLLLEGLSSSLSVGSKLFLRSESPTSAYTQYDKDLGWISVPNYYEKNLYDPGVYLRINSQGFRSNEDFPVKVPQGKLRILCSGDSMTFGSGVTNDNTWCQLLATMSPRLETINLAQAGYGVDQMYLWYLRAGAALDQDVHIFAFVTDDFRRMELTSFSGYGKPILRMVNGEMVTSNVPVPKESSFFHWWVRHSPQLMQLKSLSGLAWFLGKISPGRNRAAALGGAGEEQRVIVGKIIDALEAISRQKHTTLILVYLPTRADYSPDETILAWRKFLQAETAKRGVAFIDLLTNFQKLPLADMEKLFICADSSQYFATVKGHLTKEGHEYTARQLYESLSSMPEIAPRLTSAVQDRARFPSAAAHQRAALGTGKSADSP
jgi:hypothetical protein